MVNFNNKADRKLKIETLIALSEGKLKPEALRPGKYYCFLTYCSEQGVYVIDNKKYTEAEYLAICKEVEERNNSIKWHNADYYGTCIL